MYIGHNMRPYMTFLPICCVLWAQTTDAVSKLNLYIIMLFVHKVKL